MANEILLICKPPLETLPPVLSAAVALRTLGYKVSIATSTVASVTKRYLEQYGVHIFALESKRDVRRGILAKGLRWFRFHHLISDYLKTIEPGRLLWIASADTAISMGPQLLWRPYILQIHELYDKLHFYRTALRPFARNAACIVVPEVTRAAIYRYWYALKSSPVVVPNKFGDHEPPLKARIRDLTARKLLEDVIHTQKIVLYQGLITPERDIRPVAVAVSERGWPWRFVAMGRDIGFVSEVAKVCPSLIHIPFVDPPLHLDVTSHAHIGVLTYTRSSLNHLFCAPNKVWEFAAMGIPMICDDLPALKTQVSGPGAGECVEFSDKRAIDEALLRIDLSYNNYRSRARELYRSVSVPDLIANAVEQALGNIVDQGAPKENAVWTQQT